MSRANSNINYVVTATTSQAQQEFRSLASEMDKLKRSAGESSAFGQIGKTLQGAGAVAGFAIIGKLFGDATGKAVEFRDAIDEGRASLGSVLEEAAQGLPVVGGFARAGRNIREFFTGEIANARRELVELNKEAERLENRRKMMDGVKSDVGRALGSARDAVGLLGPDGVKLEGGALMRARAAQEFRKNSEEVAEMRKRAIEAGTFKGEQKAEIDELAARYGRIYGAALVEAEDADTQARQKLADELAAKDREMFRGIQQRNKEARERFVETRDSFVSRVIGGERESLEARRDALRESAIDARPRLGATAAAVTSSGLADVLASRERRSSDPGVKIAQEQRDELKRIASRLEALGRIERALPQLLNAQGFTLAPIFPASSYVP